MNSILVMLRAMGILFFYMLFSDVEYRCSTCNITIWKNDTKCFRCDCIFGDEQNEKH